MNKPHMDLSIEDDEGNGYYLIRKASLILHSEGFKQEAENIKQEACVNGYDFYVCLKLLKKYMDI